MEPIWSCQCDCQKCNAIRAANIAAIDDGLRDDVERREGATKVSRVLVDVVQCLFPNN
jgi:hypothetical protein